MFIIQTKMNWIAVILILMTSQPSYQNDLKNELKFHTSPSNQTVIESEQALFICSGTHPHTTITWFLNGTLLTNKRSNVVIVNNSNTSVLKFKSVRKKDQGSVICKISRSSSSSSISKSSSIATKSGGDNDGEQDALKSIPVYLNVIHKSNVVPGFPASTGPSRVVVFTFEHSRPFSLNCPLSGDPSPTVNWLKDHLPLNFSDSRIKVINTGIISGIQVTSAAELDSGKYECYASNVHGTTFSPMYTVYVKQRQNPPIFSIKPKNETVSEGGDVNLTCLVVGAPVPTVRWFEGNVDLEPDASHYGLSILSLTNVRRSRNLTCKGHSILGDVSTTIHITVKNLPKLPDIFEASEITSKSAKLFWSFGNDESKLDDDLAKIIVFLEAHDWKSESVELEGRARETTFHNLKPHTTYNATLKLINKIGAGQGKSLTFVTNSAAPSSAPHNIRMRTQSPNTMLIRWDEPLESNGVIESYKVYYTQFPDLQLTSWSQHTTTTNHATIGNLLSAQKYFVAISAFNAKGVGPVSKTLSHVLVMTDNPDPPDDFKTVATTATTSTLSWKPINNTDVVGFLIDFVRIQKNDSDDMKTNFKIRVENNNANDDVLFKTVDNLMPNSKYLFKIATQTADSLSDFTEPLEVFTSESVPSSPPINIKYDPFDSNSIKITWAPLPPNLQNGKILGYRLHHTPISTETEQPELGKTINMSPSDLSYTLKNLITWSKHQLKMNAYTKIGEGPWSETVEVQTLESVPGEPRKFKLSSATSTSITATWKAPSEQTCVIRGYLVYYMEVDDNNDIYVGSREVHAVPDASATEATVTGLKPATTYDFQVSAYSKNGDGAVTKPRRFRTLNVVIGEPQNFKLKLYQEHPPIIKATWTPPLKAINPNVNHGRPIQGYKLIVLRLNHENDGDDQENDGYEREIKVDGDVHEMLVPHLVPGNEYEFQLSAQYLNEYGASSLLNYIIPSSSENTSLDASNENETNVETPNETGLYPPIVIWAPDPSSSSSSSSSSMVVVKMDKKHEEGNDGVYYLAVVEEKLAMKRMPKSFKFSELITKETNPQAWICGQFHQSNFPVEFQVGDGLKDQEANNRKLDLMNNAYRFFIRLVLNTGEELSSDYTTSVGTSIAPHLSGSASLESGPNKHFNILFTLVALCVAVVLILIIILVVVALRRRKTQKLTPISAISPLNSIPSNSSMKMVNKKNKKNKDYLMQLNGTLPEPVDALLNTSSDDYDNKFNQNALNSFTGGGSLQTIVPLPHLMDRIEMLKLKDREMLRKEYESIDPGKQFTWNASNVEVNRCKNRYANVVAYDHSRVVLPSTGVPGSDYINANFIDCRFNNACSSSGGRGGSMYIATQGPLPETIGDFWRMVWEERVSTIAMVTKLEERNRTKCDQYWPDIGTQVYGPIQVTLKDVLELSSYTIRTFNISKANFLESREVFQLQFTSWPDHGVPAHPTILLQYIRRVKSANQLAPGPIVVHCSAGVGRTGTLIAIDTCMDRIQHGADTIDVFATVTRLRSQRNYMVQSDDQYQFIYEALLEIFMSPVDTEVAADNLNQYVQDMVVAGSGSVRRISRLSEEFQKLSVIKYEPQSYQYANMPFNKMKNRSISVLPLDSTRVIIQPIRGVDGSDYINANYIDGYRYRKCYIATQSPLATTVDDFWRMVWDNDCSIIVMLTNLVEMGKERCCQYWPVDRSMRYQYFVLDPSSSINFGHYVVREFRMTDARDGQSRVVFQYQFLNWPQDSTSLNNFIPPSSSSSSPSPTQLINATLGQQFVNFIGQVETMRSKLMDPTQPITIHCELGAGRTGVFVALSYILERMRTEGVVDVFETVKILRTQRMSMVMTEDLYSFCYRSAAEYLCSFDHYTK